MYAPNLILPKTRIAGLSRKQTGIVEEIHASGHWAVVIRRAGCKDVANDDIDYIENLVVNTGLDRQLDAMWVSGQASPTWYMGLTDSTPTAAASDTMASHAGWTEIQAYTEASRVIWTPGAVASQSVSNVSSPGRFTINADSQTIGGCFNTDSSTKGGSSGLLASVGAFQAGDKGLDNSDTLDVTAQYSMTSS